MNYKIVDKEKYYRGGVYRHFTEDCGCATCMTSRIDVTDLVANVYRLLEREIKDFVQ